MPSFPPILQASKELGIRDLVLFASYQVKLRSGWYRVTHPRRSWEQKPLEHWLRQEIPAAPAPYARYRNEVELERRFFFEPEGNLRDQLLGLPVDAGETTAEAEAILGGSFRLFGGRMLEAGFPPAWGAAVGSETESLPLDRHWSVTPRFRVHDIKLVWELSRFSWVFPLARAYRLTEDERFAIAFWTLIASWREHNPPNTGPNWYSAQEVALRLLATVFGWYAFAPYVRQEPQRSVLLAQTLGAFAERIPCTLGYARSQANNHLLSEACALYTVGLLFPEFKQAPRWKKLGRKWLLSGLREQVFQDGGYTQHSSNYHRLALSLGVWAGRLAALNQEPFPRDVMEKLGRSTRCLMDQMDPGSGTAANYGHNDGSHLLPLSGCGYRDYRPALQAAGILFLGHRLFAPGPWDEVLLWQGLRELPEWRSGGSIGPVTQETGMGGERWSGASADPGWTPPGFEVSSSKDRTYPQAGLVFAGGVESWATLRGARFRSRPAHSDQLNLDLWWRGVNILQDMGSYSYNAPAPWDNPFSGAASHNAPLIDGSDPMQRAGRFLWLDWAQARFLDRRCSPRGRLELIAAEHDGYRQWGIKVRRTVLRAGDDLWLVIDDLFGGGRHRCQWHWTLPDWNWAVEAGKLRLLGEKGEFCLQTQAENQETSLYRGGERLLDGSADGPDPTRGWISPTYSALEPALCWQVRLHSEFPRRIFTWIAFNQADPGQVVVQDHPLQTGLPAIDTVDFGGERLAIPRE